MLDNSLSRRQLMRFGGAGLGAAVLTACGTNKTPVVVEPIKSRPKTQTGRGGNQLLRIFACSGFLDKSERVNTAVNRLNACGFQVSNAEAAYRRYQRFAGSDFQRVQDLQDVATGRVSTPKVLLGARGGYGAIRLLPQINWDGLGGRMREQGTLLMGYSDVCAIQLALLAQTGVPSFAGPMLYSEFGSPNPSTFTMQNFIDGTTQAEHTVNVGQIQSREINVSGTFWGGNLSVLQSLAGTPYMPDINGGILFIEDVNEQPYRIERALQTLHLAGILKKQQAIVFGDFRMGNIRDSYDASYNLSSVMQTIQSATKVPVLTGFPFGHISNKVTMPLGAKAHMRSTPNGGYQVRFSDYPVLNAQGLNLAQLLPQPAFDGLDFIGSHAGASQDTQIIEAE